MKLLYKKKCLVIHTQNRRVLIDFGALIEYPFSYISFTSSHFVELFVIKLNDTVQRKKNKEKKKGQSCCMSACTVFWPINELLSFNFTNKY